MIRFALFALLINLVPVLLFATLRHRVARLPQPGAWWLGAVAATVVATLSVAEAWL